MKWLTLIFFVFIAAVVVAADEGRLPALIVALYAFPAGDKVGHFVLFGLLAFLLGLSLPLAGPPRPWLTLAAAGMVLAVLVGAEEWSQSYFANRHASWADLASSYAGILSFTCLAWARRRQQHAISQPSWRDKETPRA